MYNLMTKLKISIFEEAEKNAVYTKLVSRSDQKDIERLFARLFSTEDGAKALAYLQYTTFQKAFGINTSCEQLRYMEGQRAFLANILRLIERGKQG